MRLQCLQLLSSPANLAKHCRQMQTQWWEVSGEWWMVSGEWVSGGSWIFTWYLILDTKFRILSQSSKTHLTTETTEMNTEVHRVNSRHIPPHLSQYSLPTTELWAVSGEFGRTLASDIWCKYAFTLHTNHHSRLTIHPCSIAEFAELAESVDQSPLTIHDSRFTLVQSRSLWS